MKRNLVLLDTDHIKKYVFATDTLKEIRGASALFDELNRITMPKEHISQYKEVAPDMTKEEIEEGQVYANGGAGMFWVPEEITEEFIQTLRQKYREETVTGSITGVSVSESPDENDQQLLQHLFLKAQIAKADSSGIKTIPSHPLFKYCESCGNEYAVKHYEDELLCPSCTNKRKRDGGIKQEIQDDIIHFIQHPEQEAPDNEKLWHRILFDLRKKLHEDFSDRLKAHPRTSPLDRPNDLNQLGEMSTPSNYIGLIYADGNNMGTIIDSLSVSQLGEFSTTVDEAIRKAVVEAIRSPLWPAPDQTCFPFDILLLGGDDLVMVTTANKAIETAITITKAFYANTESIRGMVQEKTGENGPTLSVGVVFVHAKFPVATSLSLSESALKFTKKEFAKLRLENSEITPEGMINFMVVHSSNTLDFTDLYELELCDKEEHVYRTLRPYPVDKMERLQNAVKRTLHGVPKTKLHQIREAIFLDKQRATLSTFAALIRAKEQDKEEILNVVKDFAGEAKLEYPWYAVEKEEQGDAAEKEVYYYTPLLDAIELYDFIEEVGESP